MQNENDKLFGRWHELILVAIGGILTLLGAVVVFYMQSKEQSYEYSIQVEDKRLGDASAFMDGLSRTISRQIYLLMEVENARTQTTNAFVLAEQDIKIQQSQEDWFSEFPRAVVLTKQYFGDELYNKLNNDIFQQFGKFYDDSKKVKLNDKNAAQALTKELKDLSIATGYFIAKGYKIIDLRQLAKPNQ